MHSLSTRTLTGPLNARPLLSIWSDVAVRLCNRVPAATPPERTGSRMRPATSLLVAALSESTSAKRPTRGRDRDRFARPGATTSTVAA
jgi:hypothetical protein